MKQIYACAGTSKQNIHQRLNRLLAKQDLHEQINYLITKVRQEHPRMGADSMYRMLQIKGIGRDQFRKIYTSKGHKIELKRNKKRTTDSRGVKRFPNLIETMELTHVNQVWVSDITYYDMAGRFYYLTFIMDLYSRLILGYQASKDLRTINTTLPALKQALKKMDSKGVYGLILHSDGGGQYYCKAFLELTKKYAVKNSMCTRAIDNPHAERVNGTIKNNYIYPYNPQTYTQLNRALLKAVMNYNESKPHQALQGYSPYQFSCLNNSYQQEIVNSTKEKRSKKENINNNSNILKSY